MGTQFTCRGANMTPAMTWGGVPPSAKELVVVVRTLTRGNIATNWVVGGITPKRRELRAGRLPPEAVVGLNSSGQASYSLCPPTNKPSLIVFGVYALPRSLSLKTGFHQEVLGDMISNGEASWGSTTARGGT